jgi:hypothetical protein
MEEFPQLGTLFHGGLSPYAPDQGPVWTQPDGPGTTVFPQQAFGERVALFTFGCGHWSNHFDVHKNNFNPPSYDASYTVVSAFLCCPLCSYIQQIISPYDQIYDLSNYILLG